MDKEKVIQHMKAMINLYGFIPFDKFVEIYNSYNADKIDNQTLKLFIVKERESLLNEHFICVEDNKYLASFSVLVDDRFERELRLKEGLPYYLPDHEELLKYAEIGYFEETPEYLKLKNYVRKLYWRRSKADEITGILRGTCTNTNALNQLDLILDKYDVKVKNDKQAKELVYLIMDLADNTRMGENNGHTPTELAEMNLI